MCSPTAAHGAELLPLVPGRRGLLLPARPPNDTAALERRGPGGSPPTETAAAAFPLQLDFNRRLQIHPKCQGEIAPMLCPHFAKCKAIITF